MAIPLKCPGCQAAFDVPNTLAGKTIRCTSCKMQMPVPVASANGAALVDEPAPAKTAVATKVAPLVAKPLPPATKSTPLVAKALPPAEKARPDGQDDKKRPERSGSTKAKAASRRRDDDDDDDDDDRPARPRKKKKSGGGGSGMMILLVGGGVVGLIAIVVAAVVLLTGSGDKKATASSTTPPPAKNSATSTAAEVPSNTAAGGASGTSSEPAPTGGAPKGPTTMGMSGSPKKGGRGGFPGPTGEAPAAPPVPGGPNGGPGGGTRPTPPMPGMPGVPGAPPGQGGWQAFTVDGFSAELPGVPQSVNLPGEPSPPPGVSIKTFVLKGPTMGYYIRVVTLPVDISNNQDQVDQLFAGVEKGVESNGGGVGWGEPGEAAGKVRVTGRADVTQDGFRGKDFQISETSSGKELGTIRVVLTGKTIYAYGALGNPPDNVDLQRFLTSAKLTVQPQGGFAAGPGPGAPAPSAPPSNIGPGPGPMNGGGPGTNFPPNPPGVGGQPGFGGGPAPALEIRPPLTTKLSEFYAIAFDIEGGEVYTVSSRAGGAKGTLHRYTYPDFKSKGNYNIPSCATRAVIDSKSGQLFLASVTNPTQTFLSSGFDRAHAVGNLQIYDLGAIRKAETNTDIKPAATLNVGHIIRGLELSADGKSVYLAVSTPSAKNKTSIRQVDVAERKVVKDKDIPEPIVDMCLTADGTELWLTEYATQATAHPKVTIFDPATWSITKTITLPGPTTDIAPTKGGRLVAAVIGEGQAAPGGFGGPGAPGGFGQPGVGPPGGFGQPGMGGPGGRGRPGAGGFGQPPGGFGQQPPGGFGQPGGGFGGQQGGSQALPNYKLYTVNDAGLAQELILTGARASHNNYVEFSPDGKQLFVTSFGESHEGGLGAPGLDIYQVSDPANPQTYQRVGSVYQSGTSRVGGYFHISPDGKFLVFHVGAVIAIDKLTENVGGADLATGGNGFGPQPQPGGGFGQQPPPGGGQFGPQPQPPQPGQPPGPRGRKPNGGAPPPGGGAPPPNGGMPAQPGLPPQPNGGQFPPPNGGMAQPDGGVPPPPMPMRPGRGAPPPPM